LIGGWNIFCVSLGPRIFILKSIGGKIILNSHWLLKDEGPLIEGKDFETSIGQGKQSQRKVMEAYQRREEYFVWKKEERRRMNV